ncbi:hypothetical protein [Litorisediminicola beolgyonensis]|uniref:Sulfotransferase family protein n=1 Tax=Litorisediminicola beolgyonensis TaxID=1173614 RepID=A0ABW3ZDA5_9RHOB
MTKLTSLLRKVALGQTGGSEKETVHFLHIGKAAGTQITHVASQINASGAPFEIRKRKHGVSLSDLPPDARYFFSIRNPIDRFKSGFYSRKRKGQPRIYSEWSDHEAKAFETYEHANDLAEALFSDGDMGHRATAAILSIHHNARYQIDWLKPLGFALSIRPPVWIIRTEGFEDDLGNLLDRLGADVDIQVSDDPSHRHQNDYSSIPALSPRAEQNLRRWYSQDFAFYDMCVDWMTRNFSRNQSLAGSA